MSEVTTSAPSAQVRRARNVRLRAELRRVASVRRVRACGLLPTIEATTHPSIVVHRTDGRATAQWHGVGVCGHIWDCPVCSARLRVERTQRIARAITYLGGRWQMLTLTVRHHEGQLLKTLQRGLTAAWRRTRQGGKVQRYWSENVTASARTQEVTKGPNGWHPHIHVLLRTEEWSPEQCHDLWERFREAVRKELGSECVPNYSHGIRWSTPRTVNAGDEDVVRKMAHYIAKFSLEVAGVSKRARKGSVDPFDVARRAARGDQRSLRLWNDYQVATRGRRCIELDDRAQAAAEAEATMSHIDDGELTRESVVTTDPVEIPVTRDELWTLRRREWARPTIMADVLTAAETGGAGAVREWVALCEHEVRATHERRTAQSGEAFRVGAGHVRAGEARPQPVEGTALACRPAGAVSREPSRWCASGPPREAVGPPWLS